MQKANKIEIIDFIKGYSILSIVLYHFFQGIGTSHLMSEAIHFGSTGVHAFIFASGFGLYFSWLIKPLSYAEFLKRRFAKVFIPYILVVVISALISLWIPVYENNWNNFFSHLFLYKMFDNHLIGTYGYQFWFVSTILQIYLLFPIIVLLRKWLPGRKFLLIGAMISFSWLGICLFLGKSEYRNWSSFFLTYLWELMLGMYCAELYFKKGIEFWNLRISLLAILSLSGILLYSLMAIKGGLMGSLFNDVPALFGYTCLCILIYRLGIRPFNRFILFTSKWSYSIFLIHFLVLNLMQTACTSLGLNWNVLMLFPALIFCYLAAIPLQKFYDQITEALLRTKHVVASPDSLPV